LNYGELRIAMAAEAFANSGKGIPVPGTGVKRHRSVNDRAGKGVISSSRIVSHRYSDEGEKGPKLRREIRRKEKALFKRELSDS
jgi:hypothetical protein